MTTTKPKKKWVEEIEQSFSPKPRSQEVPLSLIIPTYNSGVALGQTLESIKRQNYAPLEVIVVDAGSTDQTLGILAEYGTLITRVYSVANFNLAEMINRGVSLASGQYLTAFYPGNFYIADKAYDIFAEAVIDHAFPDFVYCSCVLHHVELPLDIMGDTLSLNTLKKGLFSTTFGSSWIKADFFLKLGKLNTSYPIRFTYDMLCRLALVPKKRVVKLDRKLVDFDISFLARGRELAQLLDTWKILKSHFGLRVAFKWFFTLHFVILTKFLWRALKGHIFETK